MQPNTVQTFHKHFFAFLKRKGVIYSFKHDFNDEGGFHAWWNEVYALSQPFRKDIGNKPLQAAVDPNAEAKIRENGNYKPFSNHDDCLKLLVRATLKYNALRGASEVSCLLLLFYFFIQFIQQDEVTTKVFFFIFF
jgi:hypothetical protein